MQYLKRYKTLLIVTVAVGLVAALAWAGKIFVHEFTPLKAEVRADLLSQLREMQELAQTIKKPTSVYEVTDYPQRKPGGRSPISCGTRCQNRSQ